MSVETIPLNNTTLSTLPKAKALYAIFARDKSSGKPFHCKFVGETDNLLGELSSHFSKHEPNEGLRTFMQSSKTKLMTYELQPNTSKAERAKASREWVKDLHPRFNKQES